MAYFAEKISAIDKEMKEKLPQDRMEILKAESKKYNAWLAKVKAGAWKQIKALAVVLKARTLEFTAKKSPEATWADKLTKKWYGLSHLLIVRVFYPLLHLKKFWGLTHWSKRLGFGLLTLTMEAIGVGIMLNTPYLAMGLCVATVIPLLLLVAFSMMSSLKEKLFWSSIFAISGFYVFGFMVHHLFGSLAAISFATAGFWLTAGILLLTILPTIISAYHFMVTVRSYLALQDELWSRTARSLTGWASVLNPLRILGWHREGFYRKWFLEFQETENRYMPLLPNGQAIADSIADDVAWLRNIGYLSPEENDLWVKALRGRKAEDLSFPRVKGARGSI